MKCLLYKDWLVLKKTCRVYCLLILLFAGLGLLDDSLTFYIYYPSLMAGMLAMSLYSWDERCKWQVYCQTLPVDRKQYVLSKYLFCVFLVLPVLVLTAAVLLVRQLRGGALDAGALAADLVMCLAIGLLGPALLLPFLFWLGSEKGRLAYYLVLGLTFAVCFALPDAVALRRAAPLALPLGLAALVGVVGLLFALSAAVSVALYARREL